MKRVCILHYSATPAVGGVEGLIDAQVGALADLGYPVRLITGEGQGDSRAELVRIPEMHPAHPEVLAALRTRDEGLPPADHPLVTYLHDRIQATLDGCRACWVHNAFTVYLNPFLTAALFQLAREPATIDWVAWTEDLTNTSAYAEDYAQPRAPVPGRNVRFVTISGARRRQLATLSGREKAEIAVIHPPLPALEWLGLNRVTQALLGKCGLEGAWPVVLVPAKLLPHKNLDVAVHVAVRLRRLAAHPAVMLTGGASSHEPAVSRQVRSHLHSLCHDLGAEAVVYMVDEIVGDVSGRSTIRDLMLLSDLVLLPSREEGFGLPLVEAAALRTPVLCSNIPAFREAAPHATFFQPDAPIESIAAQVLHIASSAANRHRRLALRSRHRFRDQIAELMHAP